jgi:hypothetical protein
VQGRGPAVRFLGAALCLPALVCPLKLQPEGFAFRPRNRRLRGAESLRAATMMLATATRHLAAFPSHEPALELAEDSFDLWGRVAPALNGYLLSRHRWISVRNEFPLRAALCRRIKVREAERREAHQPSALLRVRRASEPGRARPAALHRGIFQTRAAFLEPAYVPANAASSSQGSPCAARAGPGSARVRAG